MADQELSFQHKKPLKIFLKINFLWQKKKRDTKKHPVQNLNPDTRYQLAYREVIEAGRFTDLTEQEFSTAGPAPEVSILTIFGNKIVTSQQLGVSISIVDANARAVVSLVPTNVTRLEILVEDDLISGLSYFELRAILIESDKRITDEFALEFTFAVDTPEPAITSLASRAVTLEWDSLSRDNDALADVDYHIQLQSDYSQRIYQIKDNQIIIEDLTPKTKYLFHIFATYENKQTDLRSLQFKTLPAGPKVSVDGIRTSTAKVNWNLEELDEDIIGSETPACRTSNTARMVFRDKYFCSKDK